MSGRKIIEGLKRALAWARGEEPEPVRVWTVDQDGRVRQSAERA